jgi:hypothetical protein
MHDSRSLYICQQPFIKYTPTSQCQNQIQSFGPLNFHKQFPFGNVHPRKEHKYCPSEDCSGGEGNHSREVFATLCIENGTCNRSACEPTTL